MNTPTRNTRATIAQETLQIIEQGHYALDGVPRIEIASKVAATVAGTKLYDGGTLPSSLQFSTTHGFTYTREPDLPSRASSTSKPAQKTSSRQRV